MTWTRMIAYRLANEEAFLEVLQKGKVIPDPSETTVKGIIRLRLLPKKSAAPENIKS
jgi:hypothetical protein